MELDYLSSGDDCGDDDYGLLVGSDNFDDTEDDLPYVNTDRMFKIAEPPNIDRLPSDIKAFNSGHTDDNEDDYNAVRMLALYGSEDEDIDVTSDEERNILEEIKQEVKKNVASEMKQELDVYRGAMENLKAKANAESAQDEFANTDPKLKEAILKMRKLDRILVKKMEQEKKVKRDRIMLQKQLHEELENIRRSGRESSLEEKKNTDKFLALALPASHNAGIRTDLDDQSETATSRGSFTPLFATQPLDTPKISDSSSKKGTFRPGTLSAAPSETSDGTSRRKNSVSDDRVTTDGQRKRQTSSTLNGAKGRHSSNGKAKGSRHNKGGEKQQQAGSKQKNFIKRNVELAAEAQNPVAMTDDEKKRLEDLLADMNGQTDLQGDEASDEQQGQLQPSSHLPLAKLDDGFWPDMDEQRRLEAIDGRLKAILPAEEFEQITSNTPVLFTKCADKPHRDVFSVDNEDHLGEAVLMETREDRELKKRLKEIDERLQQLKTAAALENESPRLSGDVLNDLLEECARSISRANNNNNNNDDNDTSPPSSYRVALYENPPKLDESVLRQLLDDARQYRLPSDDQNGAFEHVNGLQALTSGSSEMEPSPDRITDRYQHHLNSLPLVQPRTPSFTRTPGGSARLRHGPFLPSIDLTGRLSTRRPLTSESLRANGDRSAALRPHDARNTSGGSAWSSWSSGLPLMMNARDRDSLPPHADVIYGNGEFAENNYAGT